MPRICPEFRPDTARAFGLKNSKSNLARRTSTIISKTSVRSHAMLENAEGEAGFFFAHPTVVPSGILGYLITPPTGTAQPLVSALTAHTGTVVANAANVPFEKEVRRLRTKEVSI